MLDYPIPATDGGVSRRILGTFLNFLQERESSVFVAATSNNLVSLPPEMLRKGRWDEIFFIDLPSLEERRMIFQVLLKKYRCDLSPDEDLLSLSKGFSGAEIGQAIVAALYEAFSRKAQVHLFDIKRNLHDIIPLSESLKEMMRALREWGISVARPVTPARETAQVSPPIPFIAPVDVSMGSKSRPQCSTERLSLKGKIMIPEKRIPTHPGEILAEEFLKPLGISQVAFAAHIGVPVQRINELVRGKRGITPKTDWLLSKALRTTPEFWLNLQMTFDLAQNRPRREVHALKLAG